MGKADIDRTQLTISVETDRTSRTGDSSSGTRLPTMQITGGYTPRASHMRGCRCEKGYDRHGKTAVRSRLKREHRNNRNRRGLEVRETAHACRNEPWLWCGPARRNHSQHGAQ